MEQYITLQKLIQKKKKVWTEYFRSVTVQPEKMHQLIINSAPTTKQTRPYDLLTMYNTHLLYNGQAFKHLPLILEYWGKYRSRNYFGSTIYSACLEVFVYVLCTASASISSQNMFCLGFIQYEATLSDAKIMCKIFVISIYKFRIHFNEWNNWQTILQCFK